MLINFNIFVDLAIIFFSFIEAIEIFEIMKFLSQKPFWMITKMLLTS